MTPQEHLPSNPEEVRIPDVARRAGVLLAAIENATAESPASLEILADEGEAGLICTLEARLTEADKLYQRHDELFDQAGMPTGVRPELDYAAILELTKDILNFGRRERALHRSALLGIGVAQLAATGARLASDPSLVIIDSDKATKESDIEEEIVRTTAALAEDTFQTSLAHRLRGNALKLPIGRLGYPGFLTDAHLAFWTHPSVVPELTPEVYKEAQKIIALFPAKSLLYDVHSYFGRPERHKAREQYKQMIKDFAETLRTGETSGVNAKGNLRVTIQNTFDSLDALHRGGYSPDECLFYTVQNSTIIGRLAERTAIGLPPRDPEKRDAEKLFQIKDGPAGPQLSIGFPEWTPPKNGLSEDARAKIQRRSRAGGICPVRYPVLLKRGGETHQHIRALATAVKERIGATPPLLFEVKGDLYVDPAALTVNYALLVISDNYHA